jgi:hypothetical protein
MGNGRAMERRPSPWLDELAPSCDVGLSQPVAPEAARRFAELRANLRG